MASRVDLTLTDESWNDLCGITPVSGDFQWGNDRNDFELALDGAAPIPAVGSLIYQEGTGLGGMVTGGSLDTSTGEYSAIGRTWTGVLDRKVLMPDSGKAYWSVSGDVRDCAAALISRLGLGGLFSVDSAKSGVTTRHTFSGSRDDLQRDAGRYMGGWAAMWQLLVDSGCKAAFRWDSALRRVVVTVTPREDRTDDEERHVLGAWVRATIDEPPNHLVCLGNGELADRTVVHVYADRKGNISTEQVLTGLAERVEVYDDSCAEDVDELLANGKARLRDLIAESRSVEVGVGDGMTLGLGDLVGTTDARSGIDVTATVTGIVATVEAGCRVRYTYETT